MESLTDTPSEVVVTSATELWMSPVEEGKALLMKIYENIVGCFISFGYLGTEDGRITSNDKVKIVKRQIG